MTPSSALPKPLASSSVYLTGWRRILWVLAAVCGLSGLVTCSFVLALLLLLDGQEYGCAYGNKRVFHATTEEMVSTVKIRPLPE